jgi:hypothetical protein
MLQRGKEILFFNSRAVSLSATQITNMDKLFGGRIPIINIQRLPLLSKFAM